MFCIAPDTNQFGVELSGVIYFRQDYSTSKQDPVEEALELLVSL